MDELLKPELTEEGGGRSLYSNRALFFTGFFGGPLAVLLLSAMNSSLLNRLKKDLPLYLAFTAGVGIFYFMVLPEGVAGFHDLSQFRRQDPFFRFGPRALALAFWAVIFVLHRPFQQAMAIMDLDPLKPWKPAILCALAGGMVQLALLFVALRLKGGL